MFRLERYRLCVCLYYGYGHMPLRIVMMEFGINVITVLAEQSMRWPVGLWILISFPFENGSRFVGLFTVTGVERVLLLTELQLGSLTRVLTVV